MFFYTLQLTFSKQNPPRTFTPNMFICSFFIIFLLLCSIFNYRTRAWTTRPAFPAPFIMWLPSNLYLKSILSAKILYSQLIYLTLTNSPAVYKQTRKMVVMAESYFHLRVFVKKKGLFGCLISIYTTQMLYSYIYTVERFSIM